MSYQPGDLVIAAIDAMEARLVRHLENQRRLLVVLIVPLYAVIIISFGLCYWAILR